MSDGWYSMHRGWLDHPILAQGPFDRRSAWAWLIDRASHQDRHQQKIGYHCATVNRGQLAVSERYLCEAWGWSKGKLWRFLNELKSGEQVVINPGRYFSVITICNYDKYQSVEKEVWGTNGEQTGNKRGTNGANNNKRTISNTNTNVLALERGARLPKGWELPIEWGNWAVSEGLTTDEVLKQEERFKDYWLAKAGKDAMKLDWQATWRNWIRRHKEGL